MPRTRFGELDDDNERLKRAIGESPETLVCFIGASGVGKSTLLNALVAGRITSRSACAAHSRSTHSHSSSTRRRVSTACS